MVIDESPSFTESELKAAFDYYSEIFNSDDVEKKMAAAATMLFQLEKFLRDRIDGLDTSAIISLLEEFAQIEKGNEPKFIKSYKLGRGQPPDVVEQLKAADVVASVDILSKYGYSVSEATKFVALKLRRKPTHIKNLRSDFNRREKLPQALERKRERARTDFSSKKDAENYVVALLKQVNKKPKR